MSSAVDKPISMPVTDAVRVSGLLQVPARARACYVLAHGAGAGMDHPFMVAVAAELARRGTRVVLWTSASSAQLLRTVPGVERVITDIGALDKAEQARWLPLMSLPFVLGTTPETVPARVPFLAADPQRAAGWRERLGGEGFKIGITWQGSTDFRLDRSRSLPLASFAPLASIDGVRLISLQKGLGEEHIADAPFRDRIETLGV